MTLLAKPETERFYTAAELFKFPEEWRCEFVSGKLCERALAGAEQGRLNFNIAFELGGYIRANLGGYCYAPGTGYWITLAPDTVKAPAFAFIALNRLAGESPGFMPLAPDLVAETRSPSDCDVSVQLKIQEWLDAGVRMVLDLDPVAQTLTVYRPNEEPRILGAEDTLEGEDVLPVFSLPLARLFAR